MMQGVQRIKFAEPATPAAYQTTAGDQKSEQDRHRHAEALADPLKARLPAGKPGGRL